MTNDVTRIKWSGENPPQAMMVLRSDGGLVVSPTKFGYILMTTDAKGLERKFTVKNRKRSKPGVVLCGSMAQLTELAEMSPEVTAFYQNH